MNRQISDFINYIKFIEQLSMNTVEAYQRDLIEFTHFLDEIEVSFDDVTSDQIRLFLTNSNKSVTSVARLASTLRRFYRFLKQSNEINLDPTQFLKVQSVHKRIPHYLTFEEFNQLISFEIKQSSDYLDLALIELLYGSGIRVSECIALKNQQYFPNERIIRVLGKGGKTRIVPLSKSSVEAINQYVVSARNLWQKKLSDYLFLNKKGEALSRHYVYNMLQRRAVEVNLEKKISPHILRHSFASELINNGADLRVIQELLGHSDVSTTEIYTHLDFNEKKRQYKNFHPGQFITIKGENNDEEV